jgi:hypothetical protein
MTIASVNLHNTQRTKVVSAGVKLPVMNKIRYRFYHFIYVPVGSLWDDYGRRNDPPLPPVPCQCCGGQITKRSTVPRRKSQVCSPNFLFKAPCQERLSPH